MVFDHQLVLRRTDAKHKLAHQPRDRRQRHTDRTVTVVD